MIFLAVLVLATAAASGTLALARRHSARQAARLGMAIAMVFAGVSHLLLPTPFVQHLPLWVPLREELVFVTGLVEVALGAALLASQPRRQLAGIALAGYLAAVFPANVYVAVADVAVDGQPGGIYPWVRLPFQLLFVGWALWSTRDVEYRSVGVPVDGDELAPQPGPPSGTRARHRPVGRAVGVGQNGVSMNGDE